MVFKHPSNVCMTYINHFYFSFRLSIAFFYGGICAIIHGIYPDVLESSSTKTVMFIQKKIKESGCRPDAKNKPLKNRKSISIITDEMFKDEITESPSKEWDFCNDSENV